MKSCMVKDHAIILVLCKAKLELRKNLNFMLFIEYDKDTKLFVFLITVSYKLDQSMTIVDELRSLGVLLLISTS